MLSPNESVKLFKKCVKSLLGKKHFFLWCPSLVLLNYNELALRKQKFFLEQMNNFVSLYLQRSFPSNLCCASLSAVFLLVIRTLQDLLSLWWQFWTVQLVAVLQTLSTGQLMGNKSKRSIYYWIQRRIRNGPLLFSKIWPKKQTNLSAKRNVARKWLRVLFILVRHCVLSNSSSKNSF